MLTKPSLGANVDTALEIGLMFLLFDDLLCKQILKNLQICWRHVVTVGLMRENN